MTPRSLPLALAAPLLAAAAPEQPPPLFSLIEAPTPQGIQEVEPGAVVSRAVLGRPDALVLGDDIALDWRGEQREYKHGDILRPIGTAGIAGVPAQVFCEDEHKGSLGKRLTGNMLGGLVGAIRPTHLDTRFCLFDTDKDERLDHAVLLGAKGDGRAPFKIAPTRYALIAGVPLSGDGMVRLRYAGAPVDKGYLSFDLEVFAFGRLRAVPGFRHSVSVAKLPAYLIVGDAVVTVLKYDPETRAATIRMDHDLAPGHVALPELADAY